MSRFHQQMIDNRFKKNKNESMQGNQLIEITTSFQQEIQYYKLAMKNAEKIIDGYKQQKQFFRRENCQLKKKVAQYQLKINQIMKSLIKIQQQRSREIQMNNQIFQLSEKLSVYQKTIEILQDKILLLNVAIKKGEFQHKIGNLRMQTSFQSPCSSPKNFLKRETQKTNDTISTVNLGSPSTHEKKQKKRQNYSILSNSNRGNKTLMSKFQKSVFRRKADTEEIIYLDNQETSRSSKYS